MHQLLEIKNKNGEIVKGNKWVIDSSIHKSIVIIHGMSEYSYRYNDFANFLNDNGYDVFALDQLGHGRNVEKVDDLLIWEKDTFSKCVDNAYALISLLKEEGREVYVFAHSMGSFMGQLLIERYPDCTDKIILCGTSGPQRLIHALGSFISKTHCKILGHGEKRSNFMNNLAFGSYNKKIKDKQTDLDWLSVSRENINNYINDPYCGGVPSRNFFASFIGTIPSIHKKKNLKKINKNIKVLFIFGNEDPVGNYGKSIRKLQKIYAGMNISTKLIGYENMRHEILNEDNHMIIYNDVLNFLNNK